MAGVSTSTKEYILLADYLQAFFGSSFTKDITQLECYQSAKDSLFPQCHYIINYINTITLHIGYAKGYQLGELARVYVSLLKDFHYLVSLRSDSIAFSLSHFDSLNCFTCTESDDGVFCFDPKTQLIAKLHADSVNSNLKLTANAARKTKSKKFKTDKNSEIPTHNKFGALSDIEDSTPIIYDDPKTGGWIMVNKNEPNPSNIKANMAGSTPVISDDEKNPLWMDFISDNPNEVKETDSQPIKVKNNLRAFAKAAANSNNCAITNSDKTNYKPDAKLKVIKRVHSNSSENDSEQNSASKTDSLNSVPSDLEKTTGKNKQVDENTENSFETLPFNEKLKNIEILASQSIDSEKDNMQVVCNTVSVEARTSSEMQDKQPVGHVGSRGEQDSVSNEDFNLFKTADANILNILQTSDNFPPLAESKNLSNTPAEENLTTDPVKDNKTDEVQNVDMVFAGDVSPGENKKQRRLPVFLATELNDNVNLILRNLSTFLGRQVYGKLQNEFVKILLLENDEHAKTVKFLKDSNVCFHTVTPTREKPFKVVIKGLPTDFGLDELKIQLLDHGFEIISMFQFKAKNPNRLLPTYVVTLVNTPFNRKIYDLRTIGFLTVKIENYRTNWISQCFKCQRWRHSSNQCDMPPRCLRCAGGHLTTDCTLPSDQKPTCANCGQPHPANYSKCSEKPPVRASKAKIVTPRESEEQTGNTKQQTQVSVSFISSPVHSEKTTNSDTMKTYAGIAAGTDRQKTDGQAEQIASTSKTVHHPVNSRKNKTQLDSRTGESTKTNHVDSSFSEILDILNFFKELKTSGFFNFDFLKNFILSFKAILSQNVEPMSKILQCVQLLSDFL